MTSPVWPDPVPGTRWLLRLPNWIGDAVMVLPALRSLPRHEQSFLGVAHPRVLPLYRASDLLTDLLPAEGLRAPLALRAKVRAYAPHRALVWTEAASGAILARLSRAALRLGRTGSMMRPLYTHPLPRARRQRPHWEELLDVAVAAGGKSGPSPDFRLDPGSEAEARAQVLLEPVRSSAPVALAPGAAYGPAKRWPLSRFVELGRSLMAAGERVIVIGGPGETALGAELATSGVLDLTGKTGLLDVVAVLSRCAALVTNDSGALHLGRAAGTRVVGVFGSSSPVWTGPEPREGAALWLGLPCSPCYKRRCPLPDERRLRCLEDIQVSTVREALEREAVTS